MLELRLPQIWLVWECQTKLLTPPLLEDDLSFQMGLVAFWTLFSFFSTPQAAQPSILSLFILQCQHLSSPAHKQRSMTVWLDFVNCTRDALSLPFSSALSKPTDG